jgi:diaminohydroxyphosphoribosylaminopyrimidine deaminase/5-amino-6-(5-phosphoribosylamino)uracil reductase
MIHSDEILMQLAIEEAAMGRGFVEPNPMVGAVIARDGDILAAGHHRQFGGPHAEREALARAREARIDVHGATMAVTLEPCCHYGKTPPCTDAIIRAGIGRVVVGMIDQDPNVARQGIAQLRQAGVEVTVGALADRVCHQLRAYIRLRRDGRPWVIAKWAQTHDGYWALPKGVDRWISSPASRLDVHQLRGRCDGIAVGIGTLLADDPLLTCREDQPPRQPIRLILDSHLRTPPTSRLMGTTDVSPILIAGSADTAAAFPERADALRQAGAEVLLLPSHNGHVAIDALLAELGKRRWTYLLLEGGPTVLSNWMDQQHVDELRVYVSPRRAEEIVADADQLAELPHYDLQAVLAAGKLALLDQRVLGGDEVWCYQVLRS